MEVTTEDGRIVEFPDDTRPEVAQAYVDRYYPKAPSTDTSETLKGVGAGLVGGAGAGFVAGGPAGAVAGGALGAAIGTQGLTRLVGHLSKGAGKTIEMIENLGSIVGNVPNVLQGRPIEKFDKSRDREWLETNRAASQVEAYPETSTLGQILGGATEFIPQMPLYARGGRLALGGAAMIPKVGKAAEFLLTKSPTALGRYGKAVARAGAEGGIVGTAIGTPAGTGVDESLKKGAEEAASFAAATSVLHPAFAGLGLVGRGILRRLGTKATPEKVQAELEKKATSDPQAAEELQRMKEVQSEQAVEATREGESTTSEGEELYIPRGTEEAVVPVQGELPLEKIGDEQLAKFRSLGYEESDLVGRSDNELIDILEKEIPNDKTNIEGLQGGERGGEEPFASEPIKVSGETETSASGVVQAPREGAKIESRGQRRKRLREEAKAAKKEGDLTNGEVQTETKAEEEIGKIEESSVQNLNTEAVDKAERIVTKLEEVKTHEVDKVATQEEKEAALGKVEEKLDTFDPEDEESTVALLKDLYDADDPTLNTLIDNMPKNREEIDLAARREAIAKAVEKAKATSVVKESAPKTREELDAYLKEKRGKGRRERKDTKKLEQEWESILAEEGMGAEGEGVHRGFTDTEGKEGLNLEEQSRMYDDIEDGVYKDESEPSGFTLGVLGTDKIIAFARKLIAEKKAIKNAPSNGVVSEIDGKKLTVKDENVIVDSTMRQLAKNIDALFRGKAMSPDFAFRNNEKVSPLIFDLHKRFFEGNFAASKRNEIVRVADTMLPEMKDKEMVRDVLEGKITDAPAHVQEAAALIRGELDAVRGKYKEYLRTEMKRNLNEDENAALAEILAGESIDKVVAKYKEHIVLDKLGRRRMRKWVDEAVIRDIAKEYTAIDSWGLEDYVTHHERGPMRIVSGGKLYAKAMSVEDAARKFVDLHDMYPEKDFQIDTNYNFEELATGISRRSYNRIVNNLQSGIMHSVEEVNNAVARRLAQKGLRGRFFIKPTKQYSPYVQDRRNFLQGEKNVFDVLYNYMYSMEKKMALDPAIDAIRKAISKQEIVGKESYTAKDGTTKQRDIKRSYLTEDEAKFLERYVEDVKGRLYKGDEYVDAIFKNTGNQRMYTRAIQASRELQANMKLGYAPVKGLINGASGLGHIYTKVGTKYITKGMEFLRTPEGEEFIKGMEPYLGVNIVESATGELSQRGTFEKLGILKPPKSSVGKATHLAIEPLAFFQAPELPVRKLTLAANYLMAKEGGLSETTARDVAIKANWFQQFTYDMASLPEIMRSPTGRLLMQFKPYLLKELEFISTLRGRELARYMGMQLALAGPRGLLMIVKSLPILGAIGAWGELEDWMNKELPRVSRGVGGALGVDISAGATFQFPSTFRDWFGPTISDVVALKKNLLDPLVSGQGFEGMEFAKTGKSMIPIFRHWANIIEQVVDKDGWVKDERGRRTWNIDNMATFAAKSLAGAEPIELNRLRVAEFNETERSKKIGEQKITVTDNLLDAIAKGKELDSDTIDDMVRLGIKPSTLRRAAKFRVLDPRMRRLLMTEITRRPEILEKYPEASDLE